MSSASPSSAVRFALATYIGLLLMAVLSPIEVVEFEPTHSSDWPTIGWLSDALRNVLLFAPMGLACIALGRTLRFAIGLGFAVSLAVELAQLALPGRFASPLDLLSNVLGTALGIGLYYAWDVLVRPTAALALQLSLAASTISILILLAAALLLTPVHPMTPYFGGWTPTLGHLSVYSGQVSEARIDAIPIPPGGPVPEHDQMQDALSQNAHIFVRGISGSTPTSLAPLITIHDDQQREILLVGIELNQLVLNRLRRTFFAGLENPSSRAADALGATSEGTPFTLELVLTEPNLEGSLDGAPIVFAPWTPGRTWFLIISSSDFTKALAMIFDLTWIALLVFPAVFWAGRHPIAWMGVALLFAAIAFIPWLVGTLTNSPLREWIALLASTAGAICCSNRVLEESKTRIGIHFSRTEGSA